MYESRHYYRYLAPVAAVLVLACLLFPTCSSAQRKVLDALRAKLDSQPGTNLDADNQVIVGFLKTLPEVARAEIADNAPVVWATLTDSTVVVVVTEPPPPRMPPSMPGANPGLPLGTPGRLWGKSAQFLTPRTFLSGEQPVRAAGVVVFPELPKSNQVRLISAFGAHPAISTMLNTVRGWFVNQGYQLAAFGAATVGDLKHVSGDGVFSTRTA